MSLPRSRCDVSTQHRCARPLNMDAIPTAYIVDDDAAVREAIATLLAVSDVRTQTYASAEAFLDSFSTGQVGCLVLDLSMPGMNGLALQQELHARNCDMPIIFLTGHGDVPTSIQAVKLGAVDFLRKPLLPDLLLARVHEAFEHHGQLRRLHRSGAA